MTKSTRPLRIQGEDTAQPQRPCAEVEPAAAARWKAAENRLYPLIMVDPVLYEAAVTLVREIADQLRRQCRTGTELAGADAAMVLARCPSALEASRLGFDARTAFDAACAYHWRALIAQRADGELPATQDGSR